MRPSRTSAAWVQAGDVRVPALALVAQGQGFAQQTFDLSRKMHRASSGLLQKFMTAAQQMRQAGLMLAPQN